MRSGGRWGAGARRRNAPAIEIRGKKSRETGAKTRKPGAQWVLKIRKKRAIGVKEVRREKRPLKKERRGKWVAIGIPIVAGKPCSRKGQLSGNYTGKDDKLR